MKRFTAFLLSVFMLLSLVACGGEQGSSSPTSPDDTQSSTHEKVRVTMATGNSGAQYFMFGSAMATAINNTSDWLEVSAVATGGSTENYNLVRSGDAQFGFCTYDNMLTAFQGIGDFVKTGAYDNLRIVMLGHTGQFTPVVWADSKFESIADLAGAKLSCAPGSGAKSLTTAALGAWGVDLPDNVSIIGYGDMAEAMKDGTIDVATCHGPNPSSYILDMISGGDIRILSQTEESLGWILENYPAYDRSVIPAGTYDGVDYDVLTMCNFSCIITNTDVPDDVIEEFLNIVFGTDLTTVYPYGDEWGAGNTHYGANIEVPFHPAAESWLKDNGYLA